MKQVIFVDQPEASGNFWAYVTTNKFSYDLKSSKLIYLSQQLRMTPILSNYIENEIKKI